MAVCIAVKADRKMVNSAQIRGRKLESVDIGDGFPRCPALCRPFPSGRDRIGLGQKAAIGSEQVHKHLVAHPYIGIGPPDQFQRQLSGGEIGFKVIPSNRTSKSANGIRSSGSRLPSLT